MSTETTVKCDHCGEDLTTCCSGYDEYRLTLRAVRIPNTSEIRYGVTMTAPKDGDFCGVDCLAAWLHPDPPAGGSV